MSLAAKSILSGIPTSSPSVSHHGFDFIMIDLLLSELFPPPSSGFIKCVQILTGQFLSQSSLKGSASDQKSSQKAVKDWSVFPSPVFYSWHKLSRLEMSRGQGT